MPGWSSPGNPGGPPSTVKFSDGDVGTVVGTEDFQRGFPGHPQGDAGRGGGNTSNGDGLVEDECRLKRSGTHLDGVAVVRLLSGMGDRPARQARIDASVRRERPVRAGHRDVTDRAGRICCSRGQAR